MDAHFLQAAFCLASLFIKSFGSHSIVSSTVLSVFSAVQLLSDVSGYFLGKGRVGIPVLDDVHPIRQLVIGNWY